MTIQTGIDYDVLISRLHGGVRAFQSLRAHRRDRQEDASSAPQTRAPDPVAPAQAAPTTHDPTTHPPMQSRVEDAAATMELGQPSAAPTCHGHEEAPASLAQAQGGRPAAASSLKLPLPTPPPRLGLIFGGAPVAPAAASAAQPRQPQSPQASDVRGDPEPASSRGPAHGEEALELAARMKDEAVRLEAVHAEHRACLALLLGEHRTELQAQAEAQVARTTQMVRELLAEHRAELSEMHARQLASLRSQEEEVAQRRGSAPNQAAQGEEVQAALTQQANLQREAHATVAQQIEIVTTIVAELGHTVGLLAVATFEDRQGRLPTVPTPLPIVMPPSPPPPLASTGASSIMPATVAAPIPTADTAGPPPSSAAPAPVTPSILGPCSPDPVQAPRFPPGSPQEAERPLAVSTSLPRLPGTPAPDAGTPTARPHRPAGVLSILEEDTDDGDFLEGVVDPDEVPLHRRLPPVTPLGLLNQGDP